MFDTIIKKANQKINNVSLEKARRANEIMKLEERPRRFVMIAFDQK